MSLDRESEAYVLAMTFLLRTPGAHVQRVICDPGCDVPWVLDELLARWRNARDVCLPGELMRALAELDDNAAFNVLNTCVWRLLRGIVKKQELRRQRAREKNGRHRARPASICIGNDRPPAGGPRALADAAIRPRRPPSASHPG